ncbi:DMT family transporter [Photobacterium sp.]|uniref:DMT family transporter n=1 Tax=Photobacterium sp. TaxID=660 RepID=UPI00299DFECF|nr:DMT family transporter [Photobacterium sp.]MDX1301042.1 DMT family transporter [Photobacterium sp.]
MLNKLALPSWLLYVLISQCFFTLGGAFIRHAGGEIPPLQILFLNYLFGLFFLLLSRGKQSRRLKLGQPKIYISRSVIDLAAGITIFYGVTLLPLANAVAISFISPILMLLLAVYFFKEKMTIAKASACLLSVIGVLIILRPSYMPLTIGVIAMLCYSVFNAGSWLFVKKLLDTDSPGDVLYNHYIITLPMIAMLTIPVWTSPSLAVTVICMLIALCYVLGHWFNNRSLESGDIGSVSIGLFTGLIFSTAWGYLFFFELPDLLTVVGAVIILLGIQVSTEISKKSTSTINYE